jgi:LytR cell envelope-related transcriptional attenuator
VTREFARRQQRERLVGISLAALGVVVLVIAVIALRSPNGRGTGPGRANGPAATTPAPETSSKPPPTSRRTTGTRRPPSNPTTATPRKLPLVVLNNTTRTRLAEQAKSRFEAGGWTVTRIADLRRDILSTCAYFDPATPGAEAAARALQRQFPSIKRVVKKFPALPAGPIVVVLTTDYS